MIHGAMQPFALTLDKFIDHAAKWHPDAEVVTARGEGGVDRIGYAALRTRAQRISGVLVDSGVVRGEHVATLAWNTQAHVEAWYAIIGMGAVCHTLNPRLMASQLAAMLVQSEARVLIASADLAPLVQQVLAQAPLVAHVLVIDGVAASFPPPPRECSIAALKPAIAAARTDVVWGGFDETAPSGLCFTSGTTGAPKGVTYTHRSSYLHTLRLLQADVMGLTAADAVLAVVPMFHANAWGLLLEHLEATRSTVPSLQRILVGGASMPPALMERLEQRLGVNVQTSWGMTELSPLGTAASPGDPGRDASLSGRPAVGVDLLLTDSDGRALPEQRGFEGRLKVRGAAVVERYFGDGENVTDDGWFDTGDLARIDARGNVTITGRAKDLIKSGGEWINPAEIEAIIAALPQVALVAVIGRADPKWGERPILVIEPRDDDPITDDDLLGALRGRVAPWWIPDAVVRIPNMPLASTGKIDKIRLRSEYGRG